MSHTHTCVCTMKYTHKYTLIQYVTHTIKYTHKYTLVYMNGILH